MRPNGTQSVELDHSPHPMVRVEALKRSCTNKFGALIQPDDIFRVEMGIHTKMKIDPASSRLL